jgi:helix-turn-helix protein
VKSILVVQAEPFLMADLTGLEMRVLGIMIAHADERGRCWPGQLGIAEKIGSDRGRVTKTITALSKKEHISKLKRGRANAYQIAERFLVVAQAARRPARPAHPGQQPSMLLPITGAKPAPIGTPHNPPTGAKPALILSGETGVKPTPTGADSTPGRESMKDIKPSPSTELDAAREESAEIRDEGDPARCARPVANSRSEPVDGGKSGSPANRVPHRAGESPAADSPRRSGFRRLAQGAGESLSAADRRVAWLSTMGDYIRDVRPAELSQYWAAAVSDDQAATRPYLNQVDAEMRGSDWYRARRAGRRRSASLSSAADERRSPELSSKGRAPSAARIFKHILDTVPAPQAWEILARIAAGHADGKAAIAKALRQLAAARTGNAAGARPAATPHKAGRRRVRA